MVTSDTAAYAETAATAVTGDGARVEGLDDVVEPQREPPTGLVYTGAYACEHLAMAQADEGDQSRADELVARAGPVSPLAGLALATRAGSEVLVTMSFETDDQAQANADSRSVLASGPAVGQGGDFTDRFTLESATAERRVVTMRLRSRAPMCCPISAADRCFSRPAERSLDLVASDAEDPVDLLVGEALVGLAGRDDQVGGELHLAQEVAVLERDIELVVHADSSSSGGQGAVRHVPTSDHVQTW